jgi:spore germination protein YaaH
MTEVFGKRLRMRDLIYIVPITPPVRSLQPEGKTYMPAAVIPRLVNAVDYLNVMTYDFSGEDAEGSAPMPWIENNIWLFMHDDPDAAKKILLGLNYYGNCKGQLNDVIMGTRFVEILQNPEFDLEWNDVSKENFITK